MKKLLVGINKGGVGKSMTSSQLARYAHAIGLRVLFIDLDDQGNSTNHLDRDQIGERYPQSVSGIFARYEPLKSISLDPYRNIVVVPADGHLVELVVEGYRLSADKEDLDDGEVEVTKGDIYLDNFDRFLRDMRPHFDVCIIDGPPTGDIRITYAMCTVDAVLSPIQLAQESIEGMGETLNGKRGVLRIRQTFNAALTFLGFLPNMVKNNAKQTEALRLIGEQYGQYMLRDRNERLQFIPASDSFADAQAFGCSIGDLGKSNSTARKNAAFVRPIFDLILEQLGLSEQIIVARDRKLRQAAAARIERTDGAATNADIQTIAKTLQETE